MPGHARSRVLSLLSISALLHFLSTPAHAQIRFDLPAQPLARALTELGSVANLNIYFNALTVERIQAPALKAELNVDEALTRLLAGSHLHAVRVDDNTVRVVTDAELKEAQVAHPPVIGKATPQSVIHLASVAAAPQESSSSLELADDTRHGRGLEEVVVTAEKREERQIDVPISLVALSDEDLQRRQAKSLEDLQFDVPGLSIESDGGLHRTVQIRGVSNLYGSKSSLIGLYIDEADATSVSYSQINPNTYDLERVEVLRGPQGTLYGEGSAGGTIRFITKNPNLHNFELNSDVAALFTPDGAPSQRIDSMLNIPLVENVFGLRFTGTFDHEGGWIDQPAADRKNFNEQNLTDARVKGLWQPASQLTVSAMAEIHRNDRSPGAGEDAGGNFTQVFNLTTTPSSVDNFDLYNLTLTYTLNSIKLLTTTSYVKQVEEAKDSGSLYPLLAPPGSGQPLYATYNPDSSLNAKILTEEVRASSFGSDAWQWTVGGFYRRNRAEANSPYYFGPAGPLPSTLYSSYSNNLSKSWSAFGDTSYKFLNRLTFGAGVRYFSDDQEELDIPPPTTQTGRFHSIDPRAYAQFKFTDNANVYASAAKGFRSGGFNALNQPTYSPEDVWTYEFGSKIAVLDSRFTADAALFYSDYTNYQISGFLPQPQQFLNITSNAGDAWIKGVEWDLAWRPLDQWTLSLNGTYLDTRFYKINVTQSSHVVGDPLDFVPKYEYTVSVERDFEWNAKHGFFRLDYNEHGRESFILRNIGPWFGSKSDVIHLLNFNAGLEWSHNLRLGVFAQNLTNDRGFTDPLSIEQGAAARARPRTFGVEFGVTFD